MTNRTRVFCRCETALDGPIIKQKMPSPTVQQPTSPMYWREKSKLSSHSMHSPGRNSTVNQSTIVSIQKQPFPSPNSNASSTNLNKLLSNSATALSTTDSISEADYYLYQQQMSPPYYHQPSHSSTAKAPAQLPPHANADTPLRRTVSVNRQPSAGNSCRGEHYPLSPTDTQPSTPVTAMEVANYSNAVTSPTGVAPAVIANLSNSSDIHIESPKNMTIVQQAQFQPYKEVTKPFEMSDFYKYSTKFRQKNTNTLSTSSPTSTAASAAVASPSADQNSPQLPPKNINLMQHHRATANNTPSIATPYTIRYHWEKRPDCDEFSFAARQTLLKCFTSSFPPCFPTIKYIYPILF